MNRPTLTYIINKVDYGGAEIGMVRLLSELDSDTFDLTVVTLKHVNPDLAVEIPDHVTIHEVGLGAGGDLRSTIAALKSIRRSDILVCSLLPSIFVGSVLGTVARVPNIYSWRHTTHRENRLRKAVYSISYRLSDGIFVDSESSKEHIVEWGIDRNSITVLPLSGVKMNDYPTVDHRSSSEPIRIGTVGRLIEKKGFDELIACAERLPEFEFHVVGDGPLAERLRQSAPNVVWHGRVSQEELHRLWGTFDIYFQPSRYEGLCITAIEAMAAGLPVVASDIDGLSESTVDGETGFLVERGDIEGFCTKLQELADAPELRERFGSAGRERASRKFSSKALARQFVDAVT